MVVNKLTFLTYFCIVYMIMLIVIYFSKERIKNSENKVYVVMMIANVVGLVLQNLSAYFSYNYYKYPPFIAELVVKFYLVYFLIFGFLLLFYIMVNVNRENKYKVLNTGIAIMGVLSFIILFLHLDMHLDFENSIFYSTGTACNFTYVCGFLVSLIIVISMIINRKNLPRKKMIPLFAYLLLTLIAIIIQREYPDVMIVCYIESLVCFLMFHTIENPDMLMVEELTKAQTLSEKTSNEKSKFLYTISADIDNRISKIEGIYDDIRNAETKEEMDYYLDELKNNLIESRNMLRRTINISDLDVQHIQVTNNKYSVKLLLNSVYSLMKNNVKEGIDFRLNISNDLPEELYGDSIKVKQILASIISNSIKDTEKGSIELRASSVIKNNVCRLFLTVEDTGKGIDIFKQNEIMNDNNDLDKEEIVALDDMDLSLKVVRKMISIIGGTFIIDSNSYGGTTINLTIDQRIVENELSKEEEQIVKYSEALKNQKSCAIVTMNKDDLKVLKKAAKKENYKVSEFTVTKDVLDNIRNNVNYDLIIIDEFMEKIDARALSKKLKVEGYNGKLLVISKNKDIKGKKELLNEGFDNILYSPLDKKDVTSKIKLD